MLRGNTSAEICRMSRSCKIKCLEGRKNVLDGENSTSKSAQTEGMWSLDGRSGRTEQLELAEPGERDELEEVGKCHAEEAQETQGHI